MHQLVSVEEVDKWRKKYETAMRALESLTPGGSECVGDPDYCVAQIRESRRMQHDYIIKQAKRIKELEAQLNAVNTR